MDQVCRACMTSSVALVDIFADQRDPSLADMLNECVDCEIKSNDQLPKKICLACICECRTAFGFKRKCEKSHEVLREKLIKLEVECDIEIPLTVGTTEEHVDLNCVKVEQNELPSIDRTKKICDSQEQTASGSAKELAPKAAESSPNLKRNEVNIQSEVLQTENWELPEAGLDLGCVKIEEEEELFTVDEPKELNSTAIENSESQNPTEECSAEQQVSSNSGIEPAAKKNQFQCPHCSKDFSQSSHLKAHIRTHTGERPFKCPHCPRAFSQASNLRKHLCIHSGERPFKCPYCTKAFTRHTDLQYHVSTHPGKRVFKCTQCTRYFIESEELEKHLRYHTGERTYNCTECSKEYTYAWQLQRHIRSHTGEHPFKCPHCLKTCVDKGDLGRHIRSHTGERPHKCPHCPKAFTRAAYLKTHINTHSKDKSQFSKVPVHKLSSAASESATIV